MKIVFAGTPAFAAVSLDALLRAGHDVTLVLTQPDRPAGRGLKAQSSAVHRLARDRGLALLQPATLKEPAVLQAVTAQAPEVLVVAAYGRILPGPLLRAVLAGDTVTGATIMQMEESLDTGPILLQAQLRISAEDTAGALHDKLATLGAELLLRALAEAPPARPQNEAEATYAARVDTSEAEIDWGRSAQEIDRQVRAFNPAPGARTRIDGVALKIWRARPEQVAPAAPGTACAAAAGGIVVACGSGGLRIIELQRAGGKRIGAEAFLAGFKLAAGARFGRGRD